ncbi:MAG: hypothetical protein R2736_15480 [Solirubrobacterales bacterium]
MAHLGERHDAPVGLRQLALEVERPPVLVLVRVEEPALLLGLERHPEAEAAPVGLGRDRVDAAVGRARPHRRAHAPRVVAHRVPVVDRDLLAVAAQRPGRAADLRVADHVVDDVAELQVAVGRLEEGRGLGAQHEVEGQIDRRLRQPQADLVHRPDELDAERSGRELRVERAQRPRAAHDPLLAAAR